MNLSKLYVKRRSNTPLEYVFRFLSGVTARALKNSLIRPNHITLLRVPIMIFALYQYLTGDYLNFLIGSIGFFLWEYLDCVDGDLATIQDRKSDKGFFLETVTDRLFGRMPGLIGFVLTINAYLHLQNIWIIVLFFAFMWSDSCYHALLLFKNHQLELGSITKKENDSQTKKNSPIRILKYILELITYYQLQNSSIFILIFFPIIGRISLIIPIIVLLAICSLNNFFLIIFMYKKVAKKYKQTYSKIIKG